MNSKFTLIGVAFVLVVFLFVALFGFGFGAEMSVLDPQGLSMSETVGEISLKEGEAPFKVNSNRYAVVAEASSFLPYDSSEHLAYGPSLAYDENWKTAWCSSESLPSLTLTFEDPTDLGSVGMVPGYATSEEMFFKNSRWKTVAVSYNGSEQVDGVDEVLDFEDTYGMQFFALNVRDIQSVSFRVLETYTGSKYSDLCLAEVDFWSDFVVTQDSEEALASGLDPFASAQTCENGAPYPDESTAEELRSWTLVEPLPMDVTTEGIEYFIPEWDLYFTILPEYKDYRAYYRQDEYSDTLSFGETSDAACLPYGDAMGIYLSKGDNWLDIPGEGSENITKDGFTLGSLAGNTYREAWFGGDILIYAFSFKNVHFTAGTLACPLDGKDCEELKSEAFMKSLLSTLH